MIGIRPEHRVRAKPRIFSPHGALFLRLLAVLAVLCFVIGLVIGR